MELAASHFPLSRPLFSPETSRACLAPVSSVLACIEMGPKATVRRLQQRGHRNWTHQIRALIRVEIDWRFLRRPTFPGLDAIRVNTVSSIDGINSPG